MFYPFKKIETKWRKIWQVKKIYEPNLDKARRPFYNLMMFPYPSAEGLHVGNMYAFTGSDIYGRFKRMNGYDVFEPIGLDGFGIHSENYALKTGQHPAKLARITEKNFYRQLESVGNSFAWDERLETYKPDYYKWTQWIFIQLFNRGLVYRAKAAVNWCLSCKTVLADEQVINGRCERCSSEVIKKELEQWFFKITKYAERLLKNLEKIDWSEKVKIAQRNWIGKKEGALIKFQVLNSKIKIEVFTTRPETIFGATYLALSPKHKAISNLQILITNKKEVEDYIKQHVSINQSLLETELMVKTGVELKGVKAVNPASNEAIPVWISDYVMEDVGTGAVMGVPAHDQRDFEFAKQFNLPIKMVICPNYPAPVCPVLNQANEGEGYLVDSGKFTGWPSVKAKKEIVKFVGGRLKVQYHLRDWLISRQRYWGPPIPLVFCENCAIKMKNQALRINIKEFSKGELENPGWIAVPEKDLPVKLPFIKNFRPTGKGESPLASIKSFYETKCPKCGGKARRETDVSDTFLDSSWYYLAYLMKFKNWKARFRDSAFSKLTRRWLPVDMYIGGAEHSVLHLMYSRFIAMVLYDLDLVHFEEPFKVFRAHGLLIREGAKISKSKGNVVNPDEYIKKFGADVFRLYLMFLAPFEQGGDFRDESIAGIKRFLERVWRFYQKSEIQNLKFAINKKSQISNSRLKQLLHQTIKKVTVDLQNLHYNTAISALMILFNEMEKNLAVNDRETIEIFLKLLAPFAPFLTEELWQKFKGRIYTNFIQTKTKCLLTSVSSRFKSIHLEKWPQWEEKKIKEGKIIFIIQINGKTRDVFEAEKNLTKEEAKRIALNRPKIAVLLKSTKPKKLIFVPNKVINFII